MSRVAPDHDDDTAAYDPDPNRHHSATTRALRQRKMPVQCNPYHEGDMSNDDGRGGNGDATTIMTVTTTR